MQTSLHLPAVVRALPAALVVLLVVLLAGVPVDAQGPADATGDEYVPNEVSGGADEGSTYQAEGDDTVHDITFPLPAGSYSPLYDSYDDPRSGGRVHRANDLMADRLTPVHAVVDGEIIFAPGTDGEPKPSYGYMIRLAGDDGMFYSYVHLNDDATDGCDRSGGPEVAYAPGIERGTRVERGQHIGWVGSSGNASCAGPHLHFEIGEDSQFQVRHNPMASLEAAEARGDFPESVTPAPVVQTPPDPDQPDPAEPGGEDGDGATGGAYTRLAGTNRIATAVALSEQTRQSARTVIVVPAGSHVEALVAAPLAGFLDAPVLLSGSASLDADVAAEIRRLGATNGYLIGTTSQLSDQVRSDLQAAGINAPARLSAADRYALSVAVAEEMLSYPNAPAVDQAILALGDADVAARAWPDALSASALAAQTRSPILLTEGDRLPSSVANFLAERRPSRLLVIGGTAAIAEDVAQDAADLSGARADRLAGATRYETSVAVADEARGAGLTADEVWVATGLDFPDALAAGPAAALAGSPLLLVDGQRTDGAPASATWLDGNAEALVVVGGAAVVTDQVASALAP